MKELSIEKANDGNYKAYTELINRLEDVKNAIKKQNYGIAMDILCKPYPEFQIIASTELKESEDARIRKVLIDYFNRYKEQEECGIKTFFGIPTDNILAWLEKQGEQKPAWSEEDESKIRHLIAFLDTNPNSVIYSRPKEEWIDWLKSIKDRVQPKQEWKPSEEQMVALDGICSYIRNKADWEISQDMVSDLYKLSEQLKKLK